jgi:outer membrane protein assembly factor BamD
MLKRIIFLIFIGSFTYSCANKELIKPGEPIDSAYEKSMAFYEKGEYSDAAYGFDLVTRMGRGTTYAKEAQYLLADSYFQNRQYLLAASEYERFISYYPQDERREEVEFNRALSYYQQSPRYRLDQTPTMRAIELFQLFNTNYPNSEFVSESAQKIDELRNKLARKNYESGQFYLRTLRYKAAAIYFDLTIDQFPESVWAEQSLLKIIETYVAYAEQSIQSKQIERYQLAVDNYEKFLQLFPQSNYRSDAEQYFLEANEQILRLSTAQAQLSSEGDE